MCKRVCHQSMSGTRGCVVIVCHQSMCVLLEGVL